MYEQVINENRLDLIVDIFKRTVNGDILWRQGWQQLAYYCTKTEYAKLVSLVVEQ